MDRTASAVWHGGLKDGKGRISTQSGVLKDSQYSFGTRFENGIGTNPEELIAAAHAGCFTMALSAGLTTANLPPESIDTKATVTFEKTDAGPTITKILLATTAKVPGADKAAFDKAAQEAKSNCPISGSSRTTPKSPWTPSSPDRLRMGPRRKPWAHRRTAFECVSPARRGGAILILESASFQRTTSVGP